MINLIRNELIKISKKKSIYITLLITLGFVILTNIIYNLETTYTYNYNSEIEFYEEQLKQLDPKNPEEVEIYTSYQVRLEVSKLIQKYGGDSSWQSQIINEQSEELIWDMMNYKYEIPNQEKYAEAKQNYENFIAKLDENDWQYFAKESLKQVENSIEEQESMKQETNDKAEIEQIEEQLEQLEIKKQILNWRLEKNICYGYDYHNQCLSQYQSAKLAIREYEHTDQTGMSEDDKYVNQKEYYNNIERAAISEYDIEHGTYTGDTSSAKGILLKVFSEYEIFIIIMAVMIAGTAVSEEFNKGTIKLLLIKPYKRITILTAKLIASLIILLIVIILVMLMQFVVGGIIQGFDSFAEPVTVYNHNSNQLEEIGIIPYLALQAIGKLPIYILLLTLAFAFSTIFSNSALAIAITLLGSMSSDIINILAQEFKLTWIKFFVTPNWDLTQYFFGGLPEFKGLTIGFSIAIIVIYMIGMLVPTYMIFKKKNIKNI